ncbi:hypothetical protein DERF_007301 [Dermatophagoides farinae]|nr:hypothetical protein DERF_007301 [Dermatophagoides farinae]
MTDYYNGWEDDNTTYEMNMWLIDNYSTIHDNSTWHTPSTQATTSDSAVVTILLIIALLSLIIAICCVLSIYIDLKPKATNLEHPTATPKSETSFSQRKRRCPAPEEMVDGYDMEAPSDPSQVFKSRKKSYEKFQHEFEMDRTKLLEKMGDGTILMKQ